MRWFPRRPTPVLFAGVAAVLLAGCAGPAEPVSGDALQVGSPTTVGTPGDGSSASPAPTTAEGPSASATSASSASAAAPTPVAPGGVEPRPAPGACVDLPEAADGVYRVADAGTVTVVRDGGRLVLADVEPATGWAAAVDHADGREVEVELRRGGEALDLEVELEDGLVAVELCSDDD
jgi:hypothetical protein